LTVVKYLLKGTQLHNFDLFLSLIVRIQIYHQTSQQHEDLKDRLISILKVLFCGLHSYRTTLASKSQASFKEGGAEKKFRRLYESYHMIHMINCVSKMIRDLIRRIFPKKPQNRILKTKDFVELATRCKNPFVDTSDHMVSAL
jgi:hypothetical protein